MRVTTLTESRTVPASPEHTYEVLLRVPLEQLFVRRHGVLPPIREVRDAPAAWDTVGATRTIVLADGGRMHEMLTELSPPHTFAYRLTRFRGPFALLTTLVEGRWRVEPDGDGARVTWTWQVHPRRPLGRVGLPVLTRFWNGYAARGLEELERHVVTAPGAP